MVVPKRPSANLRASLFNIMTPASSVLLRAHRCIGSIQMSRAAAAAAVAYTASTTNDTTSRFISYVALRSSVTPLITSNVSRKEFLKQQMDYHAARIKEHTAEVKEHESQYNALQADLKSIDDEADD